MSLGAVDKSADSPHHTSMVTKYQLVNDRFGAEPQSQNQIFRGFAEVLSALWSMRLSSSTALNPSRSTSSDNAAIDCKLSKLA